MSNVVAVFLKVKSYQRGYDLPPSDFVLNVAHIVAFHECSFNSHGGDVPYVYLDTTINRGVKIAGTLDEFIDKLETAGKVAV